MYEYSFELTKQWQPAFKLESRYFKINGANNIRKIQLFFSNFQKCDF